MSSFDFKKLNGASREKFRVNVVQIDDVVYQADLYERKWYKFWGWVYVANLMEPVDNTTKEILKAKQKIKDLEAKKITQRKELNSYINTFSNVTGSIRTTEGDEPTVDLKDALDKGKKETKPKVRTVTLVGQPAKPEQKNGNQNQRKGS